jgi:hypothetical protein
MLLVSGNDAALAIADHVGRAILVEETKRGSSIKRFVQEMRSSAASLGATHTQFADPYGLSPANLSTARDVGLIGSTVFRDARLLPFWQCARRTLSIGGPSARTVTLTSTIEMIGEDDIVGAKTGSHVSKNIYHLVVGWRAPNGQTIVAVVAGQRGPSRYNEMRAILAALPRDFPELAEAGHRRSPGQGRKKLPVGKFSLICVLICRASATVLCRYGAAITTDVGGHVESLRCRGRSFSPSFCVLQPTQHLDCARFDDYVDGRACWLPLPRDASGSRPSPNEVCLDRKPASACAGRTNSR